MSDPKNKKRAADPEQKNKKRAADPEQKEIFLDTDNLQDPGNVSQEEMQAALENTREQLKDTEQNLIEKFGKSLQNANNGADIFKATADLLTEGRQKAQEIMQQLQPLFVSLSESARQATAAIEHYFENANAAVTAFCDSDYMTQLQEIFPDAAQWIEDNKAKGQSGILYLAFYLGFIIDNLPALKSYIKSTNYTGSLADFLENEKDPDTGELQPSLFDRFLEEAEEKNQITARKVKNVDYPIDKPDSVIWGLLEENTHGQITLPIKAEKTGSKKEIDFYYSINFDVIESELPIVKRLTQYDKRVYIAAGALWAAGNNIITSTQIYRAMGYTGTPGRADREKIDKSFTKFRAVISLNNKQELAAGYNYPRFTYDGELLPFERVTERDIVNGQLVETTYNLFREPPLLSFARGRKQITSFPLKVLQSPISKTDSNLAIEDYLLERIAHAKRGTQPKKILLSTLYEHAGITTKKQKERAPEKIKNYLNHYVKCGEIKSYEMDKTSINLIL